MTHIAITTERLPDGEIRHRCVSTPDGRVKTILGCAHLSPSSAVAHSKALAARTTPPPSERRCIFEPCVATWRHWHGGFPGGYDDPADATGPPIDFVGDEPDEGVRDYNGAPLRIPANGSTTPGDPPAAVGFDPFAGAPSKAASPGSRNSRA